MSASETKNRQLESLLVPNRTPRLRWSAAAAAALACAALLGCGAPKPVHYFQLTHPPTSSLSASQTPMDAAILVRLFQTSHLYREDRIVYGTDSVEMGLYSNERWTQAPADLLQEALARGLRSSGHFRAVTTLRSQANFDFVLTGQLYAFREVTGNTVMARLRYDVQLLDLRQSKTVWRHSFEHDEPSSGKSVTDLVLAMDKNVHQSVQEVQDGIVQALTEYLRKPM
jgi:ABC-type uncharacterized transport system auxiliary subunit